MEFTEAHQGSQCCWSPNGRYLATTEKYQLFIRDAVTLELLQLYTCLDAINLVRWSPDSEYVLCAQFKRRVVQVWSVSDEEWSAKIDEGLAGLAHALWAPDSRHIITATDFQLRLTIWSLVNKTVMYIKYPKFTDKGIAFSKDGRWLAVVERRDFKDYIGIYSSETWQLLKHFPVETEDLADISWAPDSRAVAAHDSPTDYNLVVYTVDGRKLTKHQAYTNALGVKSVNWSPSGRFLAVGSYDESARVFNNISWKPVAEYAHSLSAVGDTVVVYNERSLATEAQQQASQHNKQQTKQQQQQQQQSLPSILDQSALNEEKENIDHFEQKYPLNDNSSDVSDEVAFRNKLAAVKAGKSASAASALNKSISSSATGRPMSASSSAAGNKRPGSAASSSASTAKKPSAANSLAKKGVSVGVGKKPALAGAKPAVGAKRVGANASVLNSSINLNSTINTNMSVLDDENNAEAKAKAAAALLPSQYVVSGAADADLVSIKPDPEKADPKLGVGAQDWSHDEKYLATRNDNMPNTVWVWETARLTLVAVLNHMQPIKAFKWDPVRARLAISTATNKLYLWTPEGCIIADIASADFLVRTLKWSPDGNAVLLGDKSKFCVCVPQVGK